ncbi:hypothetical protein D9M70_516490 [compost metagenome]
MRDRMAKRQHFENRAHLGNLPHLLEIEGGDADAAARFADGKPLGLQPPKSLANGNVARAEFLGDVILPQALPGHQNAGDDPLGECPADATCKCVVLLLFHRLQIEPRNNTVEQAEQRFR